MRPVVRATLAGIVSLLLDSGPIHGAPPGAELGHIDFPVTASSPAAREHFLRGVLALHSFFYDEAVDEFREAARLQPGFAMAAWGEAMALNHTIWEWQDLEGGRKALARIPANPSLPPKEQALIDAVRGLYGPGERPARAVAYAAQMERLHARWPEDDELTAFTSLALLGKSAPSAKDSGVSTRMRAGALALEVLGKNPLHPGAAHYTIHSFDDPTHAILALPAARRYARIAPEAFHARHMPAHIFVQLGMWEDAIASCESAWASSKSWLTQRHHPLASADFHSLNWLVSLYLQQGRPKKSEAVLSTFRDAIAAENGTSMRQGYVRAVLSFLQETATWPKAKEYLAPLAKPATLSAAERAVACHPTAGNAPAGVAEQLSVLTIASYAAAVRGDEPEVLRLRDELAAARQKLGSGPLAQENAEQEKIRAAATRGFLALSRQRPAEAAEEFRRAATLDDQFGGNWYAEPGLIPWEEEAGLAFLLADKPAEASEAFAASLAKRPGRTRSLLGAARAATRRGDSAAATEYSDRAASNRKTAE